jgi:hypothetical protein
MTVARMTRERPPRIHDDDLSFLNHFIQAAREARIEGHRLKRGRGQGKTCCRRHRAAENSTHQSPAINRFHRLLSPVAEMRAPSALAPPQLPHELGSQASVFLL